MLFLKKPNSEFGIFAFALVAQISFTSNSYSVTEGETAVVMLQVTIGTLGSPVTVRYAFF